MKKVFILLSFVLLPIAVLMTITSCSKNGNCEIVVTVDSDGKADGGHSFIKTNKTDFYIDNIKYEIPRNSDYLIVTGYDKELFKGEAKIISKLNYEGKTYEVHSIQYGAFSNCKGLTSVTIGNGVTYIGEGAFYGCEGLTSITIPNSVEKISDLAFQGCKGLTSVTIRSGVTSIGDHAFEGCSSLTSVTIPESVTSIGYDAFDETPWYENQPGGLVYAGKVAYRYKGAMPEGTEIELKEGTTGIAEGAFQDCKGLTSVTIPNSVITIGGFAFEGCTSLTSITIPESVTSIGMCTFFFCSGMTSVTIGNGVTKIDDYAFKGCSSLTSVTIPNSVTSIGREAFDGCTSLTSITIGNGVTYIGEYAFRGCKSLTSVIMKRSTPESFYYDPFENPENATLYVPKGSKAAYETTNYWNRFGKIIEKEM